MAIPHIAELYQPILELLEDEEDPIFIHEFEEPISDYFLLSEEERKELTLKSGRTRIFSRICNAVSHLKNGGLIENYRRGFYILSPIGKQYLNSGLKASFENLMGLKSFNAYITEQEEKRAKARARAAENHEASAIDYIDYVATIPIKKEYIDADEYISNNNHVKCAKPTTEIPIKLLTEKTKTDTRMQNLMMYSCIMYAQGTLMVTSEKMCYTTQSIKDSIDSVNKGEGHCIEMSIDNSQNEVFDMSFVATGRKKYDTSMRGERGSYKKKEWNYTYRNLQDSEAHSKANDFINKIINKYTNPTVANIIKEIRSECGPGMTLNELYLRMGWGHTMIDNWRHHNPLPKYYQFGAMCMALGTHHYVIRRMLGILSIDGPKKNKDVAAWEEILSFYLAQPVQWTKEISLKNFSKSFFSDEFENWDDSLAANA